jgi:hypothetical protein
MPKAVRLAKALALKPSAFANVGVVPTTKDDETRLVS